MSAALSPGQRRAWTAYRALRLALDARLARELEDRSAVSMPDVDVLAAVRAIGDGSGTDGWPVALAPDPRPDARTALCVRVAALADRMGWSRSRLSRQLGRMERRGLIARVPCELDGRGDDVELTEAGRAALDAAEPVLVDAVRVHFAEALTEPQLAALSEICEALTRRQHTGSAGG
ncbi:MarR family protein [Pseudonocardia hierapolitana]|uniref:MarR family protein n=1 Tax=Pseudonocardia hierapolitana TaxID=1128676 RepID=A0A561T3F8_9PSEU|nr:MarR family transcriptional regulator [Pseudonocardia hierapolitana]TWF81653.1 MarR family protein [Pseudonocardia hierapolitana]